MKKKKKIVLLIISIILIVSATATVYFGSSKDAPAVKSIKNGVSCVTITWSKCKNAKAYLLYRSSGGEIELLSKISPETNQYSDTNVISGTNYSYYVSAKYIMGESEKGAGKIKYLDRPVINEIKNYTNGIHIEWKKVKGAVKYAVYRKTAKEHYSVIGYATKGSYTDTKVKNSVKYYYRVSAVSGNAGSERSDYGAYMRLVPGKITKITNKDGYALIKWKKIQGANCYAVFRMNTEKKGNWIRVGVVQGNGNTSLMDKTAPSGYSCTYKVRAYYKEYAGGFAENGTKNTYIKKPVLNKTKYSAGKTIISWKKNGNVSGYNVYRKIGDGKLKLIKTLSANKTSFSEKKPKKNVKIEYAVSSIKNKFESVLAYTGLISYVDANKPMVALTFDDGPNGNVTQTILNVLSKYDARATFFVVGERAGWEESVKAMKRAAGMGCEIGNHTYYHTYSSSELLNGLEKTTRVVKKAIGEDTHIMRPPGGSYGGNYKSICPYPMIMWSVDTRDWESRNADSVFNMVKKYTYDGAIILMHDLYGSTAQAVTQAVPWLIKQGYQLVTVSELMQARGIEMKAGAVYFDARK